MAPCAFIPLSLHNCQSVIVLTTQLPVCVSVRNVQSGLCCCCQLRVKSFVASYIGFINLMMDLDSGGTLYNNMSNTDVSLSIACFLNLGDSVREARRLHSQANGLVTLVHWSLTIN